MLYMRSISVLWIGFCCYNKGPFIVQEVYIFRLSVCSYDENRVCFIRFINIRIHTNTTSTLRPLFVVVFVSSSTSFQIEKTKRKC